METIAAFFKLVDSLYIEYSRESADNNKTMQIAKDIAVMFSGFSLQDRNLAKDLEENQARFLISLSGILAAKAIDSKDKDYIRTGITFHIIEDFRFDYRENYRYLVLLYYAATRLDLNFKIAVSEQLILMSRDTEEYMVAFSNRNPSLNNLSLLRLSVAVEDNKTKFIPLPDRKFTKPGRR